MIRVLLFLLPLALGIYAFIDCLTTEEQKVRSLPKIAWVFIILFFWPVFLGPIGWLAAGRPKREYAPGGGAGAGFGFGGRGQGRQMAPDDDPDFLASLNKDGSTPGNPTSSAQEQDEMLKRWEEDLKRREDDLRRPDQDNPDGRAKD
jgi:phospholipase D-like protein